MYKLLLGLVLVGLNCFAEESVLKENINIDRIENGVEDISFDAINDLKDMPSKMILINNISKEDPLKAFRLARKSGMEKSYLINLLNNVALENPKFTIEELENLVDSSNIYQAQDVLGSVAKVDFELAVNSFEKFGIEKDKIMIAFILSNAVKGKNISIEAILNIAEKYNLTVNLKKIITRKFYLYHPEEFLKLDKDKRPKKVYIEDILASLAKDNPELAIELALKYKLNKSKLSHVISCIAKNNPELAMQYAKSYKVTKKSVAKILKFKAMSLENENDIETILKDLKKYRVHKIEVVKILKILSEKHPNIILKKLNNYKLSNIKYVQLLSKVMVNNQKLGISELKRKFPKKNNEKLVNLLSLYAFENPYIALSLFQELGLDKNKAFLSKILNSIACHDPCFAFKVANEIGLKHKYTYKFLYSAWFKYPEFVNNKLKTEKGFTGYLTAPKVIDKMCSFFVQKKIVVNVNEKLFHMSDVLIALFND